MRNDKHIALKLRRQGKSYRKISKELGVAKSTLSEWFGKKRWSRTIKTELTRRANYTSRKRFLRVVKERQAMWERWRESFRREARKEFPRLIKNPLFVSGINLYWGEGDHQLKNGAVKLVNTDPRIINLFSKFLKEIIKATPEKIRPFLILYKDLSETRCLHYWSNVSDIPISQFRKTQVIRGRHPTRKTTHGMCVVAISSRGIKEKIFVWIELLYKRYGDTISTN